MSRQNQDPDDFDFTVVVYKELSGLKEIFLNYNNSAHSDSHVDKSVMDATRFKSGGQYLYVVRIQDDAK